MEQRLALVTGATSGIGEAVCRLFAKKKLSLVITGKNACRLEEMKEELKVKLHPECSVAAVQADLSTVDGRRRVIEEIRSCVPDIIVNNAGFGLYGESLGFPVQELSDMLEVNGRAVLELTMEAAHAMVSAGKKGVILNISSAAAFQFMPQMAVYSATKAFVNHFSQSLDFELKSHGVRILTLCPGRVDTNFQMRAGAKGCNKGKFGFMTASYVAAQVWDQIESLDSLRIIDWKYRAATFLSFLLPKSLVAAIVGHSIKKSLK